MIDGRHARDGALTWPMIRAAVEDCWRQCVAILDGREAAASAWTPSRLREHRSDGLAEIADLLDTLRLRVASVRSQV